jgi:protein-disulfide isomerase
MSKKQSDTPSKRQIRKEELRQRERRQQITTLSILGLAVLIILVLIIVPSIQSSANPGGKIIKITPGSYLKADGTKLGDPNAKVKIDLFEDFQCSSCKKYTNEYEPLVIEKIVNTGMAYYVFHQYAFMDAESGDKGSTQAALASECAAEQNRFWDYKKMVFTNQTGITGQFPVERLIAFAKALGLNTTQFKTCLETAKYQANLDAGFKLGQEMGVTGTPSVFVNGKNVSPGMVPTYNQILQAVTEASQGS